jgi:hypothetical protein
MVTDHVADAKAFGVRVRFRERRTAKSARKPSYLADSEIVIGLRAFSAALLTMAAQAALSATWPLLSQPVPAK